MNSLSAIKDVIRVTAMAECLFSVDLSIGIDASD